MNILFEETQRFSQKWIWILLIVSFIIAMAGAISPFFQNPTETEFKTLVVGNIITISIFGLLVLLLYVLKLNTKIKADGIRMQYFPFLKRKYTWTEIESAEIIDYGFVGGWGIRIYTKYGTVYNVAGSKGLHIKLRNGKSFVIGTQKSEQLEKVIKSLNLGV